jgi:hypothetical protein
VERTESVPPPAAQGEAEALLPSPEASVTPFTDPAVVIAFLMERTAATERDARDAMAGVDEAALLRQEGAEIDAMKREASDLLTEAWATGLMGMGAGAWSTQNDEIALKQATFVAQMAQQRLDDAKRSAGDYDAWVGRALDAIRSFLEMQNQTKMAIVRRG